MDYLVELGLTNKYLHLGQLVNGSVDRAKCFGSLRRYIWLDLLVSGTVGQNTALSCTTARPVEIHQY